MRYEPGTFCWVGLATSDPDSAKAFYATLFGWEAEDLSAGAAGTYTMLRHRGGEVAILYRQQPEARAAGAPPHWTSYISVADAGATAAKANELGGAAVFREPFDVLDHGRVAAIRDPTGAIVSLWQPRSRVGATLVNDVGALCWNELATAAKANDLGGAAVFREPFDVLDHGRVAAIRDPTGAIVSLWQPRSRVGATLVNDVGALCWNELATTDVEPAKSFFAELLGWEYQSNNGGYVSIKNAGSLNGGIREQTAQERGIPPNWRPYFTVENAENAAGQAAQLGGRELVPTTGVHTGRFAVIADPQGAAFAVFQGETDP